MGGAGASDDLDMGYQTQTWCAVSDNPAATVSGQYWHHRRQQRPAVEAPDSHFQEQLLTTLAKLTHISLF